MAFFDETAIPEKLYYVSAFSTLESEGVKALLDLLRREIRGHGADLLVIDGFLAIEEFTSSMRDMKRFIQEVQAYAVMANCTVLLLTNGADRPGRPEHTMVDGLIELDDQMFGVRTERSLRVKKFRGSGFLPGRHYYGIGEEGLVVHPRIEARYATPSFADVYTGERRSTGNDRFDEMLHGGLPAATTTALIGPTGSGKTTFGLQFLSACSAEQPGLAFGFYETPPRLRGKAASLGIDLAGLEADGHVELLWQAQGENVLDELGHRLLDAVPRRGVKRLLLDGLGGMIQSAVHPDRITRFFAVLANELRARGVTTVYTLEMEGIYGSHLGMPVAGISSLVENLIMFRRVEERSQVRRTASILKLRDSDFDPSIREFRITSRGIVLGDRLVVVDDDVSDAT